jgi:hypothetical protein
MSWRRTTIANVESLSDTEVWEYRLPTSGVVSGVLFDLRATNGATQNDANPIYKNINFIEVCDGSRVLHRLTGVQAEMVSLVNTQGVPRSRVSEVPDVVQTYQALIQFGKKLFDNEFGLDLSKLTNPRIRVDFDLTNVRAAGATAFVTGSASISAVLFINDGADVPSPAQFIKSHEIKRWTTAASGEEMTQAPLDGAWGRLFVRAHVAGSIPSSVLTDIRVSFDSGQRITLDEKTVLQAQAFPLMFGGHPRLSMDLFRTDGETIDTEHAGSLAYTLFPDNALDGGAVTGQETGNIVTDILIASAGTVSSTDRTWALNLWPSHPYMAVAYDFMPQGNLEVSEFQTGNIVLTQAVASAEASIVLQQFMENVAVT